MNIENRFMQMTTSSCIVVEFGLFADGIYSSFEDVNIVYSWGTILKLTSHLQHGNASNGVRTSPSVVGNKHKWTLLKNVFKQ